MDTKLQYIYEKYPNAHCELLYQNIFQLLIAVTLSAQTTDKRVNACTPILFAKYDTIEKLAQADIKDVKEIIRPIGMTNTKAIHIIQIAQIIHEQYHDEVPSDKEKLLQLPGVGTKTINVVLAEGFKIPAFPVDTHVNRIAKRLKFASLQDDVSMVEKKLKKKVPESLWIQMHHSMIFFGRYFCKAVHPHCDECDLRQQCRKTYK